MGNSMSKPMECACSVFECTICAICRTAKDDGKQDTSINNSLAGSCGAGRTKTPKICMGIFELPTPALKK